VAGCTSLLGNNADYEQSEQETGKGFSAGSQGPQPTLAHENLPGFLHHAESLHIDHMPAWHHTGCCCCSPVQSKFPRDGLTSAHLHLCNYGYNDIFTQCVMLLSPITNRPCAGGRLQRCCCAHNVADATAAMSRDQYVRHLRHVLFACIAK
jgi:hypothetical protein